MGAADCTSIRIADDAARTEQVRQALVDGERPGTVGLYLSAEPEPGTLELIAWLASVRVRVLLPVLAPHVVDQRPGDPDWAPYGGTEQLRQGDRDRGDRVGDAARGDALLRELGGRQRDGVDVGCR